MRNYRFALLTLASFVFCISASAQNRKFSISEATNGLRGKLAVDQVHQPTWQPNSHHFFQVVKQGFDEYLVKTALPSGSKDTLASIPQLNKEIFGADSLKGLPIFHWIDHDYAYFNNGNTLYRGALTRNGFLWDVWVSLPDDAKNVTVHKTNQLAFTRKNNLWLADRKGQLIQITDDKDSNIISGQAVHRNEFGIDRGIFFSPHGSYLAYYHMDQSMVDDYPIVNWEETPATVDFIKYPMAGRTSHHVSLKVYDLISRRTVTLQTGEPLDHYLTSVTWSPDERFIYVAVLNREQNQYWLNQYDVRTGKKLKTLFTERDDKYVEPQHPMSFLPNQNDRFIWWSARDGYWQLYLFDTEGRMIRKLTPGHYDVNELVGFRQESQEVIFASAKESPLERHIYAVNWETGRMRRLDSEPGVHSGRLSDDGKYLFDRYSSTGVPGVSLIRSTATGATNILLNSIDPLKDYDRPKINSVILHADDGTKLYGKLILPIDLDSTRRYPVIVYLYNGPHVQLIKNSFPESGNLWYEYLAQRGYVVFSMDGRGSSNRGKTFEQVTFRQLGTVEMADQLKGVAFLKSLPFVDSTRMGVHGWSYGGFMTTSLMLRYPGVFQVGVAGGPVIDWKMYEVMYTERYMDTPAENPEGYATANLLTKVDRLRGKLLMIHGTDDPVVVWQHSLKFLKSCVDQGVQVDYFVYPGHPHNVRGKDRVHLMEKITAYFDEYLK